MNPHRAPSTSIAGLFQAAAAKMVFRFGRSQHTQKEKSFKQKYLKSQSK
jgi:hypothetical protein